MLQLYESKDNFPNVFEDTRKSLVNLLGEKCAVEHIGSTAVAGLAGKGVIDILIGLDSPEQIRIATATLRRNGYFDSINSKKRSDYIFMASSEDETTIGNVHLHLTLDGSELFESFIKVRDFLRARPTLAKEYSNLKYKIAKETNYDREEYKKQKSMFIEEVLKPKA